MICGFLCAGVQDGAAGCLGVFIDVADSRAAHPRRHDHPVRLRRPADQRRNHCSRLKQPVHSFPLRMQMRRRVLTDRCLGKGVFVVCGAIRKPQQDAAAPGALAFIVWSTASNISSSRKVPSTSAIHEAVLIAVCRQRATGGKTLQQLRARRKDHHRHLIFPLQMAKYFQRSLRQRLERSVHGLGHVEEQHYGKRQLIAAEIADRLRDTILRELKILCRQRIHRTSGLPVLYRGVQQDELSVDMDGCGRGLRGRCRRLCPGQSAPAAAQ